MDVRSYFLVTAAYWGFTLTDGALRMLVLLHFHELGYQPVSLAFLFLLYEFCGIVTNLVGGWIGSRFGLRVTLLWGLAIQVFALTMLSFVQSSWVPWASVVYVMAAQALSGVAKDLTKMSSKSAVKLIVADANDANVDSMLFQWVAILTGSKNALKGLGFLLGGVLLAQLGFQVSLWVMAGALAVVLILSVRQLKQDMGKAKQKIKFKQLFSKSREINILSIARCFLFGSRDVWFVVALPIFLTDTLGWSFSGVGGFLAAWVIGYGIVQAAAPKFVRRGRAVEAARLWGFMLPIVSAAIATSITFNFHATAFVLGGLGVFAVVFAVNSAVHSYLILAYTDADKVAMNVGFYYMANACGRLTGTLLSGVIYWVAGLAGCLWVSTLFVLVAAAMTLLLPVKQPANASATGS